jgi:hypothetical protein
MASAVEICNRALQKLGARRITTLTEDSVNARACNTAYDPVRLAELRAHPWAFAIKLASLAADSTAPAFGKSNAFQLPSDYVRLVPPYPEDNYNSNDWEIQGLKIYTNDSAPLNIRYVADITDANTMDPLFREALAAKLAEELAEELTQSNPKKEKATRGYEEAIAQARRANAIVSIAQMPPDDPYITVRL